MPPKVVVATLTWNQKDDVLNCLRTVTALDYPNYEVAMVDNGSSDGTTEEVRRCFPQVHCVIHSQNLGCAEGVNGEIRYVLQTDAKYLFIIANDAIVEPQTLKRLVDAAERDPKLGVVFPKVYYLGTEKRIWLARGIRMADIDWLRGRFTGFIQNVEDDGQFDREEETVLYAGGFCLVRLEAIHKVGFLDPGYFIFYDDADWLMRIHRAGYRGLYVPQARAWHKPSSSVGKETASFYYYRTRNRLFFYKKFSSKGVYPFFFLYFLYEQFLRTLPGMYRSGMRAQARAILWGVLDYLRGKRGGRDFARKGCAWPQKVAQRIFGLWIEVRREFRCGLKRAIRKRLRIRVRVNWNLGDEIMTLPAFQILRNRYPDSTVEAEFRNSDLLKGNPYIHVIHGESAEDPDLIVDLHKELRGKSRLQLLCDLLDTKYLPFPKVYLEKDEIEAVRRKWKITCEGPCIIISPAARWFARKWGQNRWTALAEQLSQRYRARIFVLGKDEDSLPVGINLIGQTSIREAAALLSQCDLFIGSDSGLVHLALAVGTPTVGLYGPLNPEYLVAPRENFVAVRSPVECRYCWSDGRMKHPDHCPKIVPDCMSAISVSKVMEAADFLLAGKPRVSAVSVN